MVRLWDWIEGGIPATYGGGGVYALYRAGALVYVGRTGNVRSRLLAHRRRFSFDAAKLAPMEDTKQQKRLERLLISRLKPLENRSKPSDVNAVWWYRNP